MIEVHHISGFVAMVFDSWDKFHEAFPNGIESRLADEFFAAEKVEKMKVSDLTFTDEMQENPWRGHSVETPRDAHMKVSNEWSRGEYIKLYGDQVVELDGKVYRVPAFKEKIAAYSALVQKECDRWGCE